MVNGEGAFQSSDDEFALSITRNILCERDTCSSAAMAYERIIARLIDRNNDSASKLRELTLKLSKLREKYGHFAEGDSAALMALLKAEEEKFLDLQAKYFFERGIRPSIAKALKSLIFKKGFAVETRIASMKKRNLISESWYLKKYPDVANSGQSATEHYVRHGFSEGRFPHPLFDTRYYLKENKDVLESGLNPYAHYLSQGWKEGRCPNRYLETSWYIEQNLGGGENAVEPMMHYYEVGAKEVLDPGPNFSTKLYIDNHTGINFDVINPLEHFLSRS